MIVNHHEKTYFPSATYVQTSISSTGTTTTNNVTKAGCILKEQFSAGGRLKNFKKRLASGELLPFTPYRKYTLEPNPGYKSYAWRHNNNSSYYDGGNTQAFGFDQVRAFDSSGMEKAAASVLKSINSKELLQAAAADVYSQGYDALTSLGEASQTLDMILSLNRRLKETLIREAKDIKNIKSSADKIWKELVLARKNHKLLRLSHNKGARLSTSDFNNAVRVSNDRIRALQRNHSDLSRRIDRYLNGYLEARYGWRTLWYDMNELSKELSSPTRTFSEVYTSHRSRSTNATSTSSVNWASAGGTTTEYTELTFDRSVRATVSARFSASRFRANVAVTTWELVTLSFVIDWFYTVGNALKAASLLSLTSEVQACVSERVVGEVRILQTDPKPASNIRNFNCRLQSNVNYERLSRNPAKVPITPQLTKKLDFLKIADLVAISVSLLKDRNRNLRKLNS